MPKITSRRVMLNGTRHAFVDIGVEPTDDRRSKEADITLSEAHRGNVL